MQWTSSMYKFISIMNIPSVYAIYTSTHVLKYIQMNTEFRISLNIIQYTLYIIYCKVTYVTYVTLYINYNIIVKL